MFTTISWPFSSRLGLGEAMTNLYGYVITVDVILDQLSVMFSRPMPPLPDPRKLILWLLGANQQSGASAATIGNANSGRNCQANVTVEIT